MPVDIISIVVAVLALAGTVAQAVISAWVTRHSEERKRQRELRATFAKYHGPLHLAANDLSLKLFDIIEQDVNYFASDRLKEYAFMHTSFVFGQFFAWIHILRRDTQFLRPHTDPGSENAQVTRILSQIRQICRSNKEKDMSPFVVPFMIISGYQLAIGETMVESAGEGGQLLCMGYATFSRRWKTDAEFREWFVPISEGLEALNGGSGNIQRRGLPLDERLRRIQHLLVDLVEILDPQKLHSTATSRCTQNRPKDCSCTQCKHSIGTESKEIDSQYVV